MARVSTSAFTLSSRIEEFFNCRFLTLSSAERWINLARYVVGLSLAHEVAGHGG